MTRLRAAQALSRRVSTVLVACACAGTPVKQPTRGPAPLTSGPQPAPLASAKEPVPPAPARPPPQAEPLRTIEGAIGTGHPLTVQASSPSGNWVAFCQARTDSNGDGKVEVTIGPRGELGGDALATFLAVDGGEGFSIDELLAFDPTGKYLIYERGGRTLLLDTERATELDLDALGADTRRDTLPFRSHRSLVFDPAGGHLLYAKGNNGKPEVVLRELSTGAERSYDPGPGELWRAEFDTTGAFIVLRVVREDTDGNGRLQWPVPEAKERRPRCNGPVATFTKHAGRGDRPHAVVIPRLLGPARVVPDLVTVLGSDLVRREADGRLVLDRPAGTIGLTSDKCSGRVLHADSARNLLLIGCVSSKNKIRLDLYLVGPGLVKPLGIDVAQSEVDRAADGSPRLVPLYPGADTVLLDMDQRALVPQEPGDQVVATFADRALVRRNARLLYVNLEPAGTTDLGVELDRNPDLLVQGNFAYVSPWLVDLVSGKIFGPVSRRALGLTRAGRVLLAEGGDPSAERLAAGPLRWGTVGSKP